MASLSTNSTINLYQLSPASFTANSYAVTLEYLISVKFDQNNYVIRKFSNTRSVWYTILNNNFHFLNNIICISIHFFTHTYFHTCFQITKYLFLRACTKHLLNFSRHTHYRALCCVNLVLCGLRKSISNFNQSPKKKDYY